MKEKYIWYGASESSWNTWSVFIEELGIMDDILFAVDSNEKRHGKVLGKEILIYPREKIKEYPDAVILIMSMYKKEILRDLRVAEIDNQVRFLSGFQMPVLEVFSKEKLVENRNYINEHRDELYDLYQVADTYTRKILDEIIKERSYLNVKLEDDMELLEFTSDIEKYFYDESIFTKEKVTFIDCGAFTGDSIKQMVGDYEEQVVQIYALEPNEKTFHKLEKQVEDLGVEEICKCINAAVSDKNEIVYFDMDGISMSSQILEEGKIGEEVQCVALDSLELNIIGTCLLKMDVQGSELSALKGAEKLILQHLPYMAICLYHKMEDIYDIPKYIKSLSSDYELYIRGGEHLVCYAVPKMEM